MAANTISEQLLLAVKNGQDVEPFLSALKNIKLDGLQGDDAKKAFWINIYNSFFLILRKTTNVNRLKIYTIRKIDIGGQSFSLDDVEHGILRKYRYKYSLGFLPNIFVAKKIKKLAVSELDYRIHFALNCGAESCPPIAFYSLEKIDSQLEMATLSFLETETDIDYDKKEIRISRLLQWYLADFGGTKGIRKMLDEKLELNTKGYQLSYKTYSWKEDLDNFAEDRF